MSDKTQPPPSPKAPSQNAPGGPLRRDKERLSREADALRANLARRKAQARARDDRESTVSPDPPERSKTPDETPASDPTHKP